MLIHWQPAFSTSCLHAAWAYLAGLPLAEPERIAAAIGSPATNLAAEVESVGVPQQPLWRHLLGLSPSLGSNRDLAAAALRKCIGANDARYGALVPRLEGLIDEIEGRMRQEFPKIDEELALRVGPLKEQWEARGPGLLHTIGVIGEPELLVEDAAVLLVLPVVGGAGAAHLQYNAARIEAVLTNPMSSLPEPVRLGWLLAQLNCDLPRYADQIHGERLELVTELALLPLVLTAAREVEWVSDAPDLIEQALSAWRIALPENNDVAATATTVRQWWQTYQGMRPKWAVALTALDRMLNAIPTA